MYSARVIGQALAAVLLANVFACHESGSPSPASLTSKSTTAAAAAARAGDYLLRMQSPDGAWRSEAHGIVRGGAAWTAYITTVLQQTQHLREARDAQRYNAAIDRSLAFIRSQIDDEGALGRLDPDVLEYPNYSTAYALIALRNADRDHDSALRRRIRSYLVQQQWSGDRGLSDGHPAFGGWGFGEVALPAGQVGHVDLSHTRRALEAIAPVSVPGRAAALGFLALAQKQSADGRKILDNPQNLAPFDGGFYASPVVYGTNKGGIATTADGVKYFRSYATATCDGIMALLAAGVPDDEIRVQSALNWLNENADLDRVAGIPDTERGQWEDVMYYYHLNARAEVYSVLEPDSEQLGEIRTRLMDRQAPDGSFANPIGAANKEDDPLLATAFALAALGHVGIG